MYRDDLHVGPDADASRRPTTQPPSPPASRVCPWADARAVAARDRHGPAWAPSRARQASNKAGARCTPTAASLPGHRYGAPGEQTRGPASDPWLPRHPCCIRSSLAMPRRAPGATCLRGCGASSAPFLRRFASRIQMPPPRSPSCRHLPSRLLWDAISGTAAISLCRSLGRENQPSGRAIPLEESPHGTPSLKLTPRIHDCVQTVCHPQPDWRASDDHHRLPWGGKGHYRPDCPLQLVSY